METKLQSKQQYPRFIQINRVVLTNSMEVRKKGWQNYCSPFLSE